MQVVSNTSPVCNLAVIGRLDVLRGQFGSIQIPAAVRAELARLEHSGGRQAIDQACADGWIRIQRLETSELSNVLSSSLDAGEAEAIALAIECRANLLLIDESAGRAMARSLDIKLTGTLGLLLKEKREGRIPSLGMEMDRLVNEAGFFLSPQVRRIFLESAGEPG